MHLFPPGLRQSPLIRRSENEVMLGAVLHNNEILMMYATHIHLPFSSTVHPAIRSHVCLFEMLTSCDTL
jgi:hypothetical protein